MSDSWGADLGRALWAPPPTALAQKLPVRAAGERETMQDRGCWLQDLLDWEHPLLRTHPQGGTAFLVCFWRLKLLVSSGTSFLRSLAPTLGKTALQSNGRPKHPQFQKEVSEGW